jgi:hypothetical protein
MLLRCALSLRRSHNMAALLWLTVQAIKLTGMYELARQLGLM